MNIMMRRGREADASAATLRFAARGYANTTLHVMGIALTFISAGMLVGAVVEFLSTDRDGAALLVSGLGFGALGVGLWTQTTPGPVRSRDVFAAVGWTWVTMTLAGAVPYILAGTFATAGVDFGEQVVNSIFESASGYSCTGSTALVDFERPGRGLLLYRQATQWYGGMGIVVLAVTVLPYLGVGGLDLITAEAPGPSSDRLAPRVSETAKRLWLVYVGFTLTVALVLFAIPGPSLYDGFAHALSTTSTGGFSPYGASIGHFDSVAVEIAVMAGMLYGGMNFALHWRAVRGDIGVYRRDPEWRTLLMMLTSAVAVVVVILWLDDGLSPLTALRAGIFNVVSLGTSTGFGNATGPETAGDFVHWAGGAQIVILFLFIVGASTGSTSGGIKVMRLRVLMGHAMRSVRRAQQPRAVIPVKHGGHAVAEDIVSRMAGFFLLYVLLASAGVIVVTGLGGDLETSIGAVISMLGNMGPALAEAGPTASFSDAFSEPARLVLAAFMLIGRLEIFPILLMFAAPARAVGDRVRR